MYRAHVAVLGNSEAFKDIWMDEPVRPLMGYAGRTGIKISQIKSTFNKSTHKTEGWRESVSASSNLMTEFRNAILSHIRSIQRGGQAKGVIETLQSHLSSADSVGEKSSVSTFESNKTGKQGVRQNIADKLHTPEKEFAAQFQNPDNKTLFFLHRNAQIQEAPDNNIPYSINLWEFHSQDKFNAMNHSFLKAEALILYVMDLGLDPLSPLNRNWCEQNTYENSKSPAELLRYWLNLVHSKVKKQSVTPNIVLLLIHTDFGILRERSQYKENYIKAILDMIAGKPYATYITKENIIMVNKRLKNIPGELFDRITMQASWGVNRPISWLCLEAELLRRTTNNDDDGDDNGDDDEDAKRRSLLLVSQVQDLASAYNMDRYEVHCFLEFHHMLGDLFCCPPSSGERCIITNPQWFMNKYGQLVSPLSADFNWYNPCISLLNKGIVSTEGNFLKEIWELDDVQFLIDLMISFDFIFPLDNQKETYLVPCMLPREDSYKHETELTYRAVYKANIDDPHRTFHRLLSSCARQSNWKLNIDGHLSYSDASFEVTKSTQLVLTQKNDTIQVSTWTSKQHLSKDQVSNDEIRAILFEIHKDIARKAEVLSMEQSKTFRILCPHWRPGDEYVCLVEIGQKLDPRPDCFVFYPILEKCAIHNKALEPYFFFLTGEHQKGMLYN